MKFSRFNVLWEENGEYYISNTLSRNLIKIDSIHYEILKSGEIYRLNEISDSIETLKNEGILVDDELDEIGMLRFSHQQSMRASGEIEVVFAPTLSCNFKCVYCFETPRAGMLTEENEEMIFNYLTNHLQENQCKKLRFLWFGGEPLLCPDIIERFTYRLRLFCLEKKIELFVAVITNGYLLTRQVVNMLEKVGVNHIQITIDGCKEMHDSRRKLVNGEGTFDVILHNLEFFTNSTIDVAIRVNIDRENLEEYKNVKKVIDELNFSNIECHPALIEKTSNQCCDQKERCIIGDETNYYYDESIKRYYCKNAKAELDCVSCSCDAEHISSLVIDELGNIYKCWNSIGLDSDIYKKIYDDTYINPRMTSIYLGRDPFTEKECAECRFVPICAGGCLFHWLNSGTHKCTPAKYLYKEFIKLNRREG